MGVVVWYLEPAPAKDAENVELSGQGKKKKAHARRRARLRHRRKNEDELHGKKIEESTSTMAFSSYIADDQPVCRRYDTLKILKGMQVAEIIH